MLPDRRRPNPVVGQVPAACRLSRRKIRAKVPSIMGQTIYHMCRRDEWQAAQATGHYGGSSQDVADGFIHFSTAAQVVESAARHRAGQTDLLLLAVDSDDVAPILKWEPSRRGLMFPHLYGPLPVAVATVMDLPLDLDSGLHRFPPLKD